MPSDMEPVLTTALHLLPVLDELIRIESLFHAAHPDATPADFERLVAPDFWEVGASGNRYSRAFALQVLNERRAAPDPDSWRTSDHHVSDLGHGHHLLSYTLAQPGRVTRRMSLWRRVPEGWQVVYHQGTVVSASPSGAA